jgi:hypothetical protein
MTSESAVTPAGQFMELVALTVANTRCVPRVPGCYFIYVDGQPYYAGMSAVDLRKRLHAHAAGKGSRLVRSMIAQGKAVAFEYCEVEADFFAASSRDVKRTESWFMLLHTGRPLPGNRRLDGLKFISEPRPDLPE